MKITRKAALISFAASVAILGLKFWAYVLTDSTAVLSDAVESIVNVLAAALALVMVSTAESPADEDHPYGHGKLEYFSSAFEGGLITFAGLVIAWQAVQALVTGAEPRNLDAGVTIAGLAALANWALGFYLLRVGRNHRSEALKASGHHVMSDVWSTVGAIVGLILVRLTGWGELDAVMALVIAAQLSFSGYKITRRSLGALVDEVEPQVLEDLARAFEKSRRPGVIDIHLVRVIRSGHFHHVDAHLVVPEFWNVAETHVMADAFEKAVVAHYPDDGEIAFHIDPCFRDYCSRCELGNCPVRRKDFVQTLPFTAGTLTHRPTRDLA